MKNCYKGMIACVLIALALFVVLPKFGYTIAGASLLIPLLMIGCCVLPMLFMMKCASPAEEKGGCCGKTENSKTSTSDEKEQKVAPQKPSCH